MKGLVPIVVVAFALRLLHVLALRGTPGFETLDIDPAYYDAWAQRIAAGEVVGSKPFFMEPLYPYFLGALYAVFGRSLMGVRVVQVLLGTGTVVLVALAARRVFGEREARVAGWLAAVFLPFVFFEGEVEKTCLSVFLVALTMWLFVGGRFFGSGVALAFASLARGNLVAMIPLASLSPRGERAGVRGASLLLGAVLVLGPVWLRNSMLAGTPTVSSVHGGHNFYLGNWRGNQRGSYEAPAWLRPNPEFEQADFRAQAEAVEHRPLSDAEVSRFWFAEGFREIGADVPHWLWLMLRKARLFFSDYEVPDNQDFYFLKRSSWVLSLPLPTFGWLLPLAAVGALAHRARREVRLMLGFVALYAASVVAFFVFARYRVQVAPVLCVLAGAGAVTLVERRTHWVAAALAAVVAFVPVYGFSRDSGVVQSLTNEGALYVHRGQPAVALERYAEALKLAPAHERTLRDQGVLLASLGRADEARAALEKCVQVNGRNAECWMALAKVHDAAGRLDDARGAYQHTLEGNPGNPEAAFNLATVAQKQGRFDEAISVYRQMLQTLPDEARVHHNLALALLAKGALDEARTEGARSEALGLPLPEPVRAQLGL